MVDFLCKDAIAALAEHRGSGADEAIVVAAMTSTPNRRKAGCAATCRAIRMPDSATGHSGVRLAYDVEG